MYETNINETFLHETLALGFDETLRKLIEKSKKAFYLEYYDKLLHVKFNKGKKMRCNEEWSNFCIIECKNSSYSVIKANNLFHVFSAYGDGHSNYTY